MLVQVAVAEDANEWLGLIALLFSTVIGPLLVLRRGRRHRRSQLQAPTKSVLIAAPDEPGVEAGIQPDLVATVRPQGDQSAEYDAEGYPMFLQVHALPAGPPVDFLREASVGELTALRRAVPPSSRARITRKLWQGRWVRWGGEVREITEQKNMLSVMIVDSRRGFVYLTFPLNRRPVVESLREGDRIAFTGQIREFSDMCAYLVRVDVSVRRSDGEMDAVRERRGRGLGT